MRQTIYKAIGLAVLLGIGSTAGEIPKASAGVDVGLSINLGFPMPQGMIMTPSGVYFVSNPGTDVFFYGGYWWAPRGDIWYRASDYNGGWVVVGPRVVPAQVIHVYHEPNYRVVYRERGHMIPYGQWKARGGHHERTVERSEMKFEGGGKLKQDKPMKSEGRGWKGEKGGHGKHGR